MGELSGPLYSAVSQSSVCSQDLVGGRLANQSLCLGATGDLCRLF